MRIEARNGMVVVEVEAVGMYGSVMQAETMTPLEAERAIKELRKAVDAVYAGRRKKKRLGEY